ncbi:MAG: hypothetical protein SW833_24225 [Cyanobacteriota bacterium]|nr:hypothetical protein [Cyanobacteriota bacterium]
MTKKIYPGESDIKLAIALCLSINISEPSLNVQIPAPRRTSVKLF